MQIVWDGGDMFIRDIVARMPEPKPNYNTVATQVKFLEEKGFLGRRPMANSFQYTALISEREYRGTTIGTLWPGTMAIHIRNWYPSSWRKTGWTWTN